MWASLGEYSKIDGVCVDRAKRIGRWGHCLVGALQGGKPKQADCGSGGGVQVRAPLDRVALLCYFWWYLDLRLVRYIAKSKHPIFYIPNSKVNLRLDLRCGCWLTSSLGSQSASACH